MDRPSSIDSVYTLLAKENSKHASVYTEYDGSGMKRRDRTDSDRHLQGKIASQAKGKSSKR